MKKLYLSKNNKKIMGVCGGLGEYFDVDPTLIRLGWVIISVIPPSIGVILYIAASLIIPSPED